MKRFNIGVTNREFNWGKMDVVELGEKGRGRHLTLIPYHAKEDAKLVEIGNTRAGNPKIVESKSGTGWLAVASGHGHYSRGTYGTVYVPEQYKDNIKIVAEGYGAYGDAGGVGSWNEFLVKVEQGTLLKLRLSGGGRSWLYFGSDKVNEIEMEEMDMFCDSMGIDKPPETFADLIDLNDLDRED